ncbi:MAG: hypothetical protein HY393_02670 [Candidatus Diapherotrites archaeon]|nr:hypothetical protein [Candidatus Diapherotrites archaeon]
MSLVGDLFFKPKQVVQDAFKKPALGQAVVFVLLPTLALILGKFILQSVIPLATFALFFANDILIWAITGALLYLGVWVFNQKNASRETFAGILTALALRGFYLALFYLVFFAVLLLVFPAFVAATQGLVEGVLSAPDYLDIFQETLEEISLVQALVFLALMLVMLLLYAYALYTLYLTVANALKKTVAVHVLALILLLIASSLITSLFSLVGH